MYTTALRDAETPLVARGRPPGRTWPPRDVCEYTCTAHPHTDTQTPETGRVDPAFQKSKKENYKLLSLNIKDRTS